MLALNGRFIGLSRRPGNKWVAFILGPDAELSAFLDASSVCCDCGLLKVSPHKLYITVFCKLVLDLFVFTNGIK